jgi:hypothetical protein
LLESLLLSKLNDPENGEESFFSAAELGPRLLMLPKFIENVFSSFFSKLNSNPEDFGGESIGFWGFRGGPFNFLIYIGPEVPPTNFFFTTYSFGGEGGKYTGYVGTCGLYRLYNLGFSITLCPYCLI